MVHEKHNKENLCGSIIQYRKVHYFGNEPFKILNAFHGLNSGQDDISMEQN